MKPLKISLILFVVLTLISVDSFGQEITLTTTQPISLLPERQLIRPNFLATPTQLSSPHRWAKRKDDTMIVTRKYADGLAQLRWSAMMSDGSVLITLCNNSNSVFGSSTPLNYSYRKVNIFVLH